MKSMKRYIVLLVAIVLWGVCYVRAESCVNAPENPGDLKTMVDFNDVQVRYGAYDGSSADPSYVARSTEVGENYVSVQNAGASVDPNVVSLRTFQDGFNSSLRIGEMFDGTSTAAGSVVEVVMDVNLSADYPILNFRYAGVLVEGGSISTNLAFYSLYIDFLDGDGKTMDTKCYKIESAGSNWQLATGSPGNHRYIDWKSVSIDFGADFNRVKKVRIKNMSLANGSGAYSYFYVSTQCLKRELTYKSYCEEFNLTTLGSPFNITAPEGFEYLWQASVIPTPGSSAGTVSGRTYGISSGTSGDYYVTYWTRGTDSTKCYHFLRFKSTKRYPIARVTVDATRDAECGDVITFTDRSYVSSTETGVNSDGSIAYFSDDENRECDKTVWEIRFEPTGGSEGYDTTITTLGSRGNFSLQFRKTGEYNYTATTYLVGCTKTVSGSFTIDNIGKNTKKTSTIRINQCPGDYFNFNGEYIYTTGSYTQHFTPMSGCGDSVVTLIYNHYTSSHIYEHLKLHYDDDISVLQNLSGYAVLKKYDIPRRYGNDKYIGRYDTTMVSSNGCDSSYTLILSVYPHIVRKTEKNVCASESYYWDKNNVTYDTTAGRFYYKVGKSRFINDTDYSDTLILRFIRISERTVPMYYCSGEDIITIKGVTYKDAQPTVPDTIWVKDTVSNAEGCMEIITYQYMRAGHIERKFEPQTICTGGTFEWHIDDKTTINLTTPCRHEYRVAYSGKMGGLRCDSLTASIVLNAAHTGVTNVSLNICDSVFLGVGEEAKWYKPYENPRITLKNREGCDSIVQYFLQKNALMVRDIDLTLCENDEFFVRGEKVTKAKKDYYDTLQSSSGCRDSVLHYIVTINPVVRDTVRMTLCRGDSTFTIRDGVVVKMGSSDTVKFDDITFTDKGCDKIRTYFISQDVRFEYEETRTICDGGSTRWREKDYSTEGVYKDTVKAKDGIGCDTTYILVVKKAQVVHAVSEVYMCDSIFMNGKWRKNNDTAEVVSTSRSGCDSFITYRFIARPSYHYVLEDTVCEGDTYYFNGRPIYQAVEDSEHINFNLTAGGCDSIYTLRLHVNPSSDVFITDTICNGERYLFGDKYLRHTGIYTYDCVNELGCDSFTTLNLTVMPVFKSETLRVLLCHGDEYKFGEVGNDTIIRTSGVYSRFYKTARGCDSICTISVDVDYPFEQRDTGYACQGEPYVWRGRTFPKTGEYYDSLKTKKGACDSVYYLTLYVRPSYRSDTIWENLCGGERIIVKGKELIPPTVYVDTNYTATGGCDSFVTYIINRSKDHYIYEAPSFHLCAGETFRWETPWHSGEKAMALTRGGTYSDTAKSGEKCDSIWRIRIYEEPIRRTVIDSTICPGDSVFFDGKMIKDSGIYEARYFSNPYRCDSIVRLHLFFYPSYHEKIEATICANETYDFKGWVVNKAETYVHRFGTKRYGCDSVFELKLNVLDTNIVFLRETICDGVVYHFGDTILTTSGTYTYTTKNSHWCDSTTFLNLTVMPSITTEEVKYVCAAPGWSYMHKGTQGYYRDTLGGIVVFNKPGVYHLKYGRKYGGTGNYNPTQYGCDSIHILDLRFVEDFKQYDTADICWGESYYYHGKHYTEGGDYTYTEPTYHGACDSSYFLHLTVHPRYEDTVWVTLCPDSAFWFKGRRMTPPLTYADSNITDAGCDSIHWYIINSGENNIIEQTASICSNETYAWSIRKKDKPDEYIPLTLTKAGTYDDTLHSSLGTGCWSIRRLRLVVNPTKHEIISRAICPTDSVWFGGKHRKAEGSYFDTMKYGNCRCDSVTELRIYYHPDFYKKDTVTICDNESYIFDGERVFEPKTYTHHRFTANHCDSILVLHLNVTKTDTAYIVDTICAGQDYLLGDTVLRTTGVYRYKTISRKPDHCDSVTTLNLFVVPSIVRDSDVTLCFGDTFFLRDMLDDTAITQGGAYIRRYQRKNWRNCDSICRYRVHVNPSYYWEDTVVLCWGEKYTFMNGLMVKESGVYYDSARTMEGCDSIGKITIIVNPTYKDTVRISLCEHSSIKIRDGVELSVNSERKAMEYNDSLLSMRGCDSVVTYIANMGPSLSWRELYRLCPSERKKAPPYRITDKWGKTHEFTIVQGRDTYTDTAHAQSANECDTIFYLDVVTKPEYYIIKDTTVCPGQAFVWHPQSGNSEEEIRFSPLHERFDTIIRKQTCKFCDSITELHVHLYDSFYTDIYETICQGETYYFEKSFEDENHEYKKETKLLTKSCVDVSEARSIHGCDSIVVLHLTVNPSYHDTFAYYLCPNEQLTLHGNIIVHDFNDTVPHEFHDTLKTTRGCDSIVSHLIVSLTSFIYDTVVTVCANKPFSWRGRVLTTPGIYYDSLKTKPIKNKFTPKGGVSCDSIYRLTLHHNPTFYVKREVHICSNDSFDLLGNGQELVSEPRVYKRTCPSMSGDGCDSTTETHLIVDYAYFKEQDVVLCDNDSLHINSRWIFPRDVIEQDKADGEEDSVALFWDSLLTKGSLCDSVYWYHVKLKPTYRDTIELRLCSNTTYVIRNNLVLHAPDKQESYIYPDTLISVNFCDSINFYKVVSLETKLESSTIHFCPTRDNNEYRWVVGDWDTLITVPGSYRRELTAENGCDSIVELLVENYDVPFTDYFETRCPGTKFMRHGSGLWADTPGVYIDTIAAPLTGCDTVFQLHYSWWPAYSDTVYDTICANQPYYIGDEVVTSDKDTLIVFNRLTIHNCDSTTYLYLTVRPNYFSQKPYDICPNTTIKIRDSITLTVGEYDSKGRPVLYNDSMYTHLGCDSVEQYVMVIHPNYEILDEKGLCEGEEILWTDMYGIEHIIKNPGVYADTVETAHGCDDVRGLKVVRNPSYDIHIWDTIMCTNDDYVWINHQRLSESGTYVDTLKTDKGCDSVVTLHLTVCRPYLFRRRDTICENAVDTFRGRFLTETGIYSDTSKTWCGCDSIFMLELRVVPVRRDTFFDTICIGDTVWWGGRPCYKNGVYFDTLTATNDLLCHVNVLYLRVFTERDSRLLFDSIADVCADALSYDIYSRFQGFRPKYYCLLYDQKGQDQGFKDIMYQDYNARVTTPVPKRFNNTYVYPDIYTVTFRAIYEYCEPDVIDYQVRFRVLYPSWIIEQNWTDVVALLKAEYNGGFTFDNYIWYVNDRVVSNMTTANLYMKELGVGDEVYLVPTRKGEDYSIPTCPITIKQFVDSSEYGVPVLIYPTTVARARARVNIESKIGGHYSVYDMYGHRLADADFEGGKLISVQLPDVTGCYMLHLETTDGREKSTKIMVY